MSNNRDIKSRSKNSLIDKVNSTARPEPQKLGNESKQKQSQKKPTNNKKQNKKPNIPKSGKSFFFRLSKVGQVMFCIYVVCILVFGFLFARSLIGKGSPQMGSRNEPIKMITKDDVNKVKAAVEKGTNAEKVDVNLSGYRLVVVMDLPDSSTAKQGKAENYKAYRLVNNVLPINEYFSSNTELNNDLFIYSSDVVPSDFDTNSKYIYQTYKNSKMKSPKSYDLLKARDEKSKKEVLETIKKSKKDEKK